MKVLNVLNSKLESGCTPLEALDFLEEKYGVSHRLDETRGLAVLNYSQIDSPKFDDVVCECRSLVVSVPYNIFWTHSFVEPAEIENGYFSRFHSISRTFDRFFNYGEKQLPTKVQNLTAREKLDGSLVALFWHNGEWVYKTRSVIMPVDKINNLDITWKEVIEEAIHYNPEVYDEVLCKQYTYIFEVTSPYNRVVTRYAEVGATLLGVRQGDTGGYTLVCIADDIAKALNVNRPKKWSFSTWEECQLAAKELRNLEEGFVMCNRQGIPQCKLKNPAYVAAHHLRGETALTPKRVMDLIIMNEQDEYLSIFSEDEQVFAPYIEAYNLIMTFTRPVCQLHEGLSKGDQKKFAFLSKDSPVAALLFMMHGDKELTAKEAFGRLTTPAKYRMIVAAKKAKEEHDNNKGNKR